MTDVNLTINQTPVTIAKGGTILDAATAAGIRIPTLCFLKGLASHANCRMCVVAVEGFRTLVPACNTKAADGMVVETDTEIVRKSRKTTLELLLARHSVDCHHCLRIGSSKAKDLDPDFCKMCFFCDCVRDGFCELQSLAREYEVDKLPYNLEPYNYPVDDSTNAVVLNPNKCIKCLRCVDVCRDVQSVHALSVVHRGPEIQVVPAMGKPLAQTDCVLCGRCVEVCPTSATHIKEEIDEVLYYLHDYSTTCVAQVSEDVLEELARLSGMKRWLLDLSQVVAGLRKIGVDSVFSEATAASFSRQQAADAVRNHAKNPAPPMILTSSHGACLFTERFFPDLKENLVVYDSPQKWFGKKAAETPFATAIGLPADQSLKTISITATNDNEGEATQTGSVDYVINARELHRIFSRCGVNLEKILRRDPDFLPGDTPAADPLAALFAPVAWGIEAEIEEIEMEVEGKSLHMAVAKTLGQARMLLKQVKESTSPYQVIRISA